ncbi:MAG TPA: LPS assembly protein LptD [Bryobacteraceae bacterium]|nr:LPS assembly protein LptD [Bryobacteraceae bacterium]
MILALPASPQLSRRPSDGPPKDFVDAAAVTLEADGPLRKWRGSARLQTTEMVLYADEIDYNVDTAYAEARGNVHFKHFTRNEELFATRAEYNLEDQKGKFYDVVGSTVTKIETRPGVLSSTSPFHFEGRWAERLGDKYILHDGMITNCRMPKPWWTLRGPKFDIVPDDRALAYKAVFRVRGMPLFYTPYFYKSLAKVPRRSGFLTPNIGNSSSRGKMFGIGYFWAINRSYDATYRLQDFTERGFAHNFELRGKPRPGADFDAVIYGVQDRGLEQPDGSRIKQGGYSILINGRADLGKGFLARGELNYLSSLLFRQSFTETFHEAIFSEVHSVGYVTKQWSTFHLDFVAQRIDNFQSIQEGDSVIIRKLPEVAFSSRDRQVSRGALPVWVSLDTTAGLLRRTQPLFQTRQYTERADFQPRVMTAFYWKGFQLIPSFSVRETHWGAREEAGRITGSNLNRGSREVFIDLITPSLARVFRKKTFLGEQLKHVIEPRASFRNVSGVMDFDKIVRFDETELVSNTTEAEISLTNRLYAKSRGEVREIMSWTVWQRRYFDPTFGGAVIPGQRNVFDSTIQLTPYAFLDQARNYSPLVSVLRTSPLNGMGIEWRADYDPLRGQMVNSSFSADVRHGDYFLSAGHTQVRSVPQLSPNANQFRGALGFGNPNHRGWNAAFSSVYDFRIGVMEFATTQVTYNTDCCGISVQYRRFNFGSRFENQFRVAFAIANIGTFGTLKKQERMF